MKNRRTALLLTFIVVLLTAVFALTGPGGTAIGRVPTGSPAPAATTTPPPIYLPVVRSGIQGAHLVEMGAPDDLAVVNEPYSSTVRVAPIERIFAHLFKQVSEPRFVVLERVVAENGALLVWEMHYRLPLWWGKGEMQVIRGASHLRFDAHGKVVWHRDYWDAAEELYAQLPGVGWLMRLMKRKLAA